MRRAWFDGFFAGVTFLAGLYAGAIFLGSVRGALDELHRASETEGLDFGPPRFIAEA